MPKRGEKKVLVSGICTCPPSPRDANSRSASVSLGTHSEVRGRNADPARHMVGLGSDDVDADWKRLEAAGVEFVERPTDYGQLRIATLKDPEGNLIQLLQPIAG